LYGLRSSQTTPHALSQPTDSIRKAQKTVRHAQWFHGHASSHAGSHSRFVLPSFDWLQVVEAGQSVDEVIFGAEWEEDHLLHQRAGDIVDVPVLVDLFDRRDNPVALPGFLRRKLVAGRTVDNLAEAVRWVVGT